jgi:hypothetical protein
MPRKPPEPLQFPAPVTFDERIRQLVRSTVAKQLYHVLRSKEELDIIEMSEEEFEAFCERVLAEEDEA